MKRVNHSNARTDPLNVIQRAKVPIDVTEVLPRFKEGGAFVKFTYAGGVLAKDVEAKLTEYLRKEKVKPWWNPFDRMRAGLVRGKPWVEDLYRLPSTRLRVEFLPTSPGSEVAELSQEQLYSFFRPYGKLIDILPQPADSKVLPRYAHVDFTAMRRSIMAKNCLHGIVVSETEGGGKLGTALQLTYDRKAKTNLIWDWISGHTRIVVPVVAALVAGITVAIFDPSVPTRH
jgi:hypothetical protein